MPSLDGMRLAFVLAEDRIGHDPEFRAFFQEHHVQLPLAKGDAAFFNPALFHAAGTNRSPGIRRMANLLQGSSAFGRAMETVDRTRMSHALYPALLSLRQAEFVLAARCLGVSRTRILLRDILPNVSTTLIVLAPVIMALALLAESALSFLSIGVQAPAASWGTIIEDGQGLIYTRPMVAIAPGLAIVLTVLALNILGDGLRDALDVRETSRRRA